MNIVLVSDTRIPVFAYGGTERVVWDLGYALTRLGHKVTFLVASGSKCDFADVIYLEKGIDIRKQIPTHTDIVHFQFLPNFDLDNDLSFPYLFTEHGNSAHGLKLPLNSVFISKNHAQRHQSDQYIYNELNWDSYSAVNFDQPRKHHHFLGKAAWRVKNVSGAIDVASAAKVKLAVLGGDRLNIKRGFRFTLSRNINFYGMVGGDKKNSLLNASNGLIFPIRWHEPFGLAIIESLYFGCPVFATPYGSLPEIVSPEYGYLSSSKMDLANAIRNLNFESRRCHLHALENFNSMKMANSYVAKYDEILDGESLNQATPQLTPSEKFLPWN